jgi:hypothetical protein
MNQPNSIPLTAFTDFKCENRIQVQVTGQQLVCGSREFMPVARIKTYRGMLSSGQTVIAQIQVFKCVACGAIHDLNAKP